MICPKCNNTMRPGSLICFRCGSRWTAEELAAGQDADSTPEDRMAKAQEENELTSVRLNTRSQIDEFEFNRRQRDRQADLEYATQKRELDYDFKQRDKAMQREDEEIAFNRKRQSLFDQDDIEARKDERAMEKLRQMSELKRQMQADKAAHEKEMATLYAHMDTDQILASQVKDMDPNAQAELAKSRDQSHVNDVLRDVIARDSKKAEEDKDRMERMFERFADRLSDVSRQKQDSEN